MKTPLNDDDIFYCEEFARQAQDCFPGGSWVDIEPILAEAWRRGSHAADWSQISELAKWEWQKCSAAYHESLMQSQQQYI